MSEDSKTRSQGELKLPSAAEMLEAGVHFGHKTSRWHPKMESYIFGAKNDVHIFDLEKTSQKLEEALSFMHANRQGGGVILFVGTKPVAKKLVSEAAQVLGYPFVTQRWLGGTLTNFKTISKRLQYYRELEEQQKTGGWDNFIKKERVKLQKKLEKLHTQLAGIKNLFKIPEAIFVADTKVDALAIREAKKTGIPVVAVCDSDSDPSSIDYPIPANDDALPALKLLIDAIVENLKSIKVAKVE